MGYQDTEWNLDSWGTIHDWLGGVVGGWRTWTEEAKGDLICTSSQPHILYPISSRDWAANQNQVKFRLRVESLTYVTPPALTLLTSLLI